MDANVYYDNLEVLGEAGQQVEVDDDFCGHVYQIHEMLHMMANYIYRRAI